MLSPRTRAGVLARAAALVVLLSALGCAKRDNAATDSAAAAATPAPAATTDTASKSAAAGAMAMLDVAKLPGGGEYLTDTDGRALYVFEKDGKDASACSDACAAAWPPLSSNGAPMAHHASIESTKLATITRPDGKTQVTYDHKPLYYFAQDKARGDIKGQDVKEFGGEWYLVKPSGEKQEAKK